MCPGSFIRLVHTYWGPILRKICEDKTFQAISIKDMVTPCYITKTTTIGNLENGTNSQDLEESQCCIYKRDDMEEVRQITDKNRRCRDEQKETRCQLVSKGDRESGCSTQRVCGELGYLRAVFSAKPSVGPLELCWEKHIQTTWVKAGRNDERV